MKFIHIEIVTFVFALCGFILWMASMISYYNAAEKYIANIPNVPKELRTEYINTLNRSFDSFDPAVKQHHEAKKKNDVIDDYVEFKMIGAL